MTHTVHQIDRERAADYYVKHMGARSDYAAYVCNPKTGNANALVQAFAKHREEARAELLEALKAAVASSPIDDDVLPMCLRAISRAMGEEA